MKTVIIILFVVLIGFGVLLSSNHYMQQDLEQATFEKAQSDDENRQLREQLAARSQAMNQVSRQLEQMTLEKQAVDADLQSASIENQQLAATLAETNARLSQSETQMNTLRQQVSNLQSNNEYLIAENTNLKGNLSARLPGENQITEALIPVTGLGNSTINLLPILLILGLPVSILLTCVLNRRIGLRRRDSNSTERRIMVVLTKEEKELIVGMRRKK